MIYIAYSSPFLKYTMNAFHYTHKLVQPSPRSGFRAFISPTETLSSLAVTSDLHPSPFPCDHSLLCLWIRLFWVSPTVESNSMWSFVIDCFTERNVFKVHPGCSFCQCFLSSLLNNEHSFGDMSGQILCPFLNWVGFYDWVVSILYRF